MATDKDSEKLIIEIELDDGKLVKGFINAKSAAADAGKDAGKSFGDNASSAANTGLMALKGSLAAAAAAAAVALAALFAGGKMVSAALENEEAVNRLNGALRLTGDYAPKTSEALQKYADQLSRLSTISGETILEQLALAKTLGATTDQSKKIAAAAADMSVALGIGFESAVSNLTRTLNGTGGMLQRVIPDIKNFTKEQLESGAAIDLVASKFKGFAETKTLGLGGSIAGIKNSFGELIEEMGKLITRSPLIIATFNVLAKYIDKATDAVSGLTNNKTGLNAVSFAALDVGKAIVEHVLAPLELLYNVGKVVFLGLSTGLAALTEGFARMLGKLADLANKLGVDNELTKGLQLFRESAKETTDQLYNDTQSSFEKIFDFDFTSRASGIVDEIAAVTQQIASKTGDSINLVGGKSSQIVQDVSADVKRLSEILKNGLNRVVSTSMETLGASLVIGASAFDNFGATIIGITGDLASQLGSAYIAIGFGIEAIGKSAFALTGGPAIAAGLALLVLGGALKAFAKKGGSTANTNSVGPQTGGDSFGSQQGDKVGSVSAPETTQERGTAININVSGSIFDSGETGRRLVDMVNEAFDTQGVKIRRGAVA